MGRSLCVSVQPGVTAVFRLPELSEGKNVSFGAVDGKITKSASTKSKKR